jgi:hypothetical protein
MSIQRSIVLLAVLAFTGALCGCEGVGSAERNLANAAEGPVCYGLIDDEVDVVISLQPLKRNRYEAFGFGTEIDRKGFDHQAFKLASEGQLSGERFILDISMSLAGRKTEKRAEWRLSGQKLFAEDWVLEEEDCRRLTSAYLKRDIRRKKRAEKLRTREF